MKIIVIFFSIYFLSLNITPCNDADIETHDKTEKILDNLDHDSHDHVDKCSPFCQCSCCSIHFITYNLEVLELVEFVAINTQNSSYINPFYDGYNGSILQPPRLNS